MVERLLAKEKVAGPIPVFRSQMKKLTKDQVVTAIAIAILLFTSLINWNIYSWLILVAIILLLVAWYFKE